MNIQAVYTARILFSTKSEIKFGKSCLVNTVYYNDKNIKKNM